MLGVCTGVCISAGSALAIEMNKCQISAGQESSRGADCWRKSSASHCSHKGDPDGFSLMYGDPPSSEALPSSSFFCSFSCSFSLSFWIALQRQACHVALTLSHAAGPLQPIQTARLLFESGGSTVTTNCSSLALHKATAQSWSQTFGTWTQHDRGLLLLSPQVEANHLRQVRLSLLR